MAIAVVQVTEFDDLPGAEDSAISSIYPNMGDNTVSSGGGGDRSLDRLEVGGEGRLVGQGTITVCLSGPNTGGMEEGGSWGPHKVVACTGSPTPTTDITVNVHINIPNDVTGVPSSVVIPANSRESPAWTTVTLRDDIVEEAERMVLSLSSNTPGVVVTTGVFKNRFIILNSHENFSILLSPTISTHDDPSTILHRSRDSEVSDKLVEEDEPEITYAVRLSRQVDSNVRIRWDLGRLVSIRNVPTFVASDEWDDDFYELPPSELLIPANSPAEFTVEITIKVKDDLFDEEDERLSIWFSDAQFGLNSSYCRCYTNFADRWKFFSIGASDVDNIVERDTMVSGLSVVAGDGAGGSLDRTVAVSWSGVSDEFGVHRYVMEAVPAPPIGSAPVWDGRGLLSGSVWGVGSRSGMLSGLLGGKDYVVRVVPSSNLDYNRAYGGEYVRFRTGDPPVLSVDDGVRLVVDEGGSVSVGVGLSYGLLRSVAVGEDDPNDVSFRVVPFVGEDDSLSAGELPDAVEGTVLAGDTTGSVMLVMADDMLVEGDETFSVRLEPVVEVGEVAGFSVGDPVGATVIDDDEGPVTVSAAGGFRSQGVDGLVEGGSSDEQWGVFTVSVSEVLGSGLLLDWQLAPGWGVGQLSEVEIGGMSTPLTDSGVVQVGAGETSSSVSLRLADDDLAEGAGELGVVFSNLRFVESRVRSGGGFPVGFVGGMSELSASVVVEASDQGALTVPAGGFGGVDTDVVLWVGGDRLGRDADRMVTVRWSDTGLAMSGRTGYRIEWGVYDAANSSFDPSASESLVVSDPGLRAISLGGLDPGGTYRVEVTELIGSSDGSQFVFEEVTTAAVVSAGWSDVDGMLELAEGGSFGLGVSLSGGRSVPVDFGFAVVGDGADDLMVADLEQEVQIGAGLLEGSLAQQVGVVDDDIVEGNETIAIGMMAGSVYEPGVAFADNYMVTVTDDDVASLSLSVSDPVVWEDRVGGVGEANSFVVEVGLDKPVASPVTVNLAMSGVEAADLVSGLTTSVEIPAGETSVEVAVEVVDDNITEAAETVVVAISSESVTLVGRDDDPVLFSATDTVSVTIQPSDVAVPAVSAVTATAGSDLAGVRVDTHSQIAVSWTLPTDIGGVAGYVSRLVPVPADGSEPGEEDWLFGGEVIDPSATSLLIGKHMGLESGLSYWVEVSARVWGEQTGFSWVRAAQPVMLSAIPTVSLSVVPVVEGDDDVVVVSANLSSPVSWDVGFSVSSTAVSATNFADFVPLYSVWMVVPAGQIMSTVEVGLLDDELVEGSERFVVGIDRASMMEGVEVAAGGSVLVTVTDDDVASVSVASVSVGSLVDEDVAPGGSASSVEFVFSLDREVVGDVVVGWQVVTSSAVTESDVQGVLSGMLTIRAGELSVAETIIIADDTETENEELLTVEITTVVAMLEGRVSAVEEASDSGSVSVVLAASDQPAPVTDEVSEVRITAGDENGYDLDRALTVWWEVPSDTANVSGYEVQIALVADSLSWVTAGTVTTLTDTFYSFRPNRLQPSVVLSEGQQYVARVRSVKTGVNGDWVESISLPAEVSTPITLRLLNKSITVVENRMDIPLVYELSSPYSHRVLSPSNFMYEQDVSNIVLGVDYGGIRWSTNFNEPGQTEDVEFVELWEDSRVDGTKSIGLTFTEGFRLVGSKLISVGNVVWDDIPIVLEEKTIRITILDDEVASVESVSVSATDSDGMSLDDRRFRVSWVLPSDLPEWYENTGYVVQYGLVVNGVLGWSDDIVVDGGDVSEFVVGLPQDLVGGEYRMRVKAVRERFSSRWVESAESVRVGSPVSVSLVEGEVAGSEGGLWLGSSCSAVGLVLSEAVRKPVRFGLTEVGVGELSGPAVGTIPAGVDGWEGQVCVADDEVVEGEEVVDVGLSVLSEGVVVGEVGSVPLRIVDDDRSLVSVSTSTPFVVEDVVAGGGAGNEVSLEVGLSKVLAQDVDVDLVFSGDGIGSGDLSSSDVMFDGLETTVRVSAGESSVSLVVEIADDDIAEPTQTLSVEVSGLSFPGGGFGAGVVSVDGGASLVEVSVASSDGFAVGVSASLSGSTNSVVEDVDGGAESVVSYVVGLDSPVDVEVRVEFVVERVSGLFIDSDVVVSPVSPLVIRAGESSGTVEVRVVDDGFREEAEEFQIRLVSVSGSPSDGSSVDITGPLGPTITISASDPDSASVEPGETTQTNLGGMSPDTGNGGSGSQPTQPPSDGAGGGQTPTTSPPDNQGGQTNQGNANQGGQTGQPTQPPDTSGGNGQSQNPATNPPTNPGSQPTTGAPTNPGGQPTGSPTSPGSQPTTGVPVNPGGQPNAGGGGGVPPVVVGSPSAGDAVSGTTFVDTVGNTHESNIGMLADLGITRGCNPPSNTRYCPDRAVTRGEMATFMVRAFSLAESSENLFGDDDGNTHESNINRLATAEITRGCNPPENSRYCPDRPVTRAQMATFIARALDLAEGSGDFTDTTDSVHSNDINRIATVGITRGCNPPTNSRYCPDRPVTRAEMATFLIRATDLQGS